MKRKFLPLFLMCMMFAIAFFGIDSQAAAKKVTSKTITKGETNNIQVKYGDIEHCFGVKVKITPLTKDTKFDSAIYSSYAAAFGKINIAETKKVEYFMPPYSLPVKNANYKGEMNITKKTDMLAATVTVHSGKVKVQLIGSVNADDSKKAIKFTAIKSSTPALRKTTLKPGEKFVYKPDDKHSNYERVNTELIFMGKSGTKISNKCGENMQMLNFKSKEVVWTWDGQVVEKVKYEKKSGKNCYAGFYNMSETGVLSTNKTVTIYSPYVYKMKKVKTN